MEGYLDEIIDELMVVKGRQERKKQQALEALSQKKIIQHSYLNYIQVKNMIAYLLEHNRYCNLLGIFVILGIAVLASRKRASINFWLIAKALLLQIGIAFCMLKTSLGVKVVQFLASGINKIYCCADEGSRFLFGNLVDTSGAWAFIFAIKVLPLIIFFGALMSLLFYLGIVQKIVSAVSFIMRPF